MQDLSQKPGFLALVLFVNAIALSENLVKKICLKKQDYLLTGLGFLWYVLDNGSGD
jgi:hypothetical protein